MNSRTTRLARAEESSQLEGNRGFEIGVLSVCPSTWMSLGRGASTFAMLSSAGTAASSSSASAEANNALLAAYATYTDKVPAFERLLAEAGGDLLRFYARVRELAKLPRAGRDALLR